MQNFLRLRFRQAVQASLPHAKFALQPFGVDREVALAGSFYALFLGIVPVTLAGLFFTARLGLKLRTLKEEATKAAESGRASP